MSQLKISLKAIILKVKGLPPERDAKIPTCYEIIGNKSMKSEECRSSRVATIYRQYKFRLFISSLTITQISIARAPSEHFASFYA